METLTQKILKWIFSISVTILAIGLFISPIIMAIDNENALILLAYLILIPIYSVAIYFLIDDF